MIILELLIDYLLIALAFGYIQHTQIGPARYVEKYQNIATLVIALGWPIIYVSAILVRIDAIRFYWTEISLTEDNSK